MDTKELERFNKGNELNDWIKHYKHQKSVMLSREGRVVKIEEEYGDANRSTCAFYEGKLARPKVFNAGVEAFFDTIIAGLQREFKNL